MIMINIIMCCQLPGGRDGPRVRGSRLARAAPGGPTTQGARGRLPARGHDWQRTW